MKVNLWSNVLHQFFLINWWSEHESINNMKVLTGAKKSDYNLTWKNTLFNTIWIFGFLIVSWYMLDLVLCVPISVSRWLFSITVPTKVRGKQWKNTRYSILERATKAFKPMTTCTLWSPLSLHPNTLWPPTCCHRSVPLTFLELRIW